MIQDFWLPGYDQKWVCKACRAVHFYSPKNGCQRCEFTGFNEVKLKMAVEQISGPSNDLRLDIDRFHLEVEWVNQPQQYYVWAKKAADAQLAFDQAKSKLDLVDAEVAKDIRDDPVEYEIDKVTKDTVDAAVAMHPQHQAAVNKVNSTRHDLQVAQAAVNALEHRKRALTILAELWIREYYSDLNSKSHNGQESKEEIRSRGARRRALLEQEDKDE